jgi:2-polyprenyl-3-methyl-5-hydroxy-6-metoxy-1,4-benzoquinol methylase
MKANCPFCSSRDLILVKNTMSTLNAKTYNLFRCNECELQFFHPLIFEDVYVNEEYSGYAALHKGREEFPIWIKHVPRVIDKMGIKLYRKKVLDVGSGDCLIFKMLSEQGLDAKNYHALDLDKKSLAACRRIGVKHTSHKFFDEEFTKQNKTKYDIIIATEVFEHQTDPQSFMETAFSSLKKGGLIILSVPNRHRFFKKFRKDEPPHHFLMLSKEFFTKNFSRNIIHIEDYCYNENRQIIPSSKFISKAIVGKDFLFPLFIPAVLLIRLMDKVVGEGIVVVMRKL